jgi:hypothetical protein
MARNPNPLQVRDGVELVSNGERHGGVCNGIQ